jgi:multicomponent Na+:H+ antiporter subunit B
VVNSLSVAERRVTNAVTLVNFDVRGLDTRGEGFILFASVLGALVLLRDVEERPAAVLRAHEDPRDAPPESEPVGVLTRGLTGPIVVFGVYMIAHGQLTPGGGFQGGVVLASAPMVLFLAGNGVTYRHATSKPVVEALEAFGAAGFAFTGALGLVAGLPFLSNVLPLGKLGDVLSGGTVPVVNAFTGLEVAMGFIVLAAGFLEVCLEEDA